MNLRVRLIALLFAFPLMGAVFAQDKPKDTSSGEVSRLVLESPNHNFGEVKSGTPLRFSFKLRNEGKADLQVLSVQPGCGCTAADFDKVIAPGKEGKITLAIEHTESYVGDITKSAAVTTNDPQMQNLTLTLHAIFKPVDGQPVAGFAIAAPEKQVGPFNVLPNDRWAAEVFSGESVNTTISLINREQTPVHIKKVSAGGNDFTVTLQTLEEGKRYNLQVATAQGIKTGRHTQTATVHTDSREAPEIPIQLEANVRPRVFATPTSMNLPGLSLESSGPLLSLGTIYVRKVGESGLKIDDVSSTLSFIQTEVNAQAEGQLYAIRLTVDKSKVTPGNKFRGTIRVKTNDQAVPVLRIPVQGSFS